MNYYSLFDKEKIKIMFFDDLIINSEKFIKEVFTFLELKYIDNINYDKIILPASKPRLKILSKAVKKGTSIFRELKLEKFIGIIKNSVIMNYIYEPYSPQKKPKISNDTKENLINIFRDDINNLQKLLGKDLSSWLL